MIARETKKLLKNNYNFDYVKLHLKFNQRQKL